MAVCDICNAPGMGTIIRSSDFKKAVQNGFHPYSTGLAIDVMASLGIDTGFETWKQSALYGAASSTDWNICSKCLKVLKPYLP